MYGRDKWWTRVRGLAPRHAHEPRAWVPVFPGTTGSSRGKGETSREWASECSNEDGSLATCNRRGRWVSADLMSALEDAASSSGWGPPYSLPSEPWYWWARGWAWARAPGGCG